MRNSDKLQQTGCFNPCSQLHISSLRPSAHGRKFAKCLVYVMETEEHKLDKEW
jgi:hypothetical protein